MIFKKKQKESKESKKHQKVNKKDTNNTEQIQVKEPEKEMKLIFISDRDIDRIPEYFKSLGVPIYGIFDSLEEVKIELMISSSNILLVVVDTGRGKFNSTKGRDDLSDTLGMCNGEEIESIVFYTDSNIKALEKNKELKTTWVKYESTLKVVERLRKLNYRFTEGRIKAFDKLGLGYRGESDAGNSNLQYVAEIKDSFYSGVETDGEVTEAFDIVY